MSSKAVKKYLKQLRTKTYTKYEEMDILGKIHAYGNPSDYTKGVGYCQYNERIRLKKEEDKRIKEESHEETKQSDREFYIDQTTTLKSDEYIEVIPPPEKITRSVAVPNEIVLPLKKKRGRPKGSKNKKKIIPPPLEDVNLEEKKEEVDGDHDLGIILNKITLSPKKASPIKKVSEKIMEQATRYPFPPTPEEIIKNTTIAPPAPRKESVTKKSACPLCGKLINNPNTKSHKASKKHQQALDEMHTLVLENKKN